MSKQHFAVAIWSCLESVTVHKHYVCEILCAYGILYMYVQWKCFVLPTLWPLQNLPAGTNKVTWTWMTSVSASIYFSLLNRKKQVLKKLLLVKIY